MGGSKNKHVKSPLKGSWSGKGKVTGAKKVGEN